MSARLVLSHHGLRGGGHGATSLDALLQAIVNGGADYATVELYAGIRPDTTSRNTSAMFAWGTPSPTGIGLPIPFSYRIGATLYASGAVANIPLVGTTLPTAPGQRRFGCYAFSIDAVGTVTCTTGAANGTYNDRTHAIAALPAVPGGSADLGFIIVGSDDTTPFVPGTSLLSDGHFYSGYFPATLVTTYTLIPPVWVSTVDPTHITLNALGGLVYQPRVPTFARVRYLLDTARYDLWVGTTGSGADLIIDNLSANPSDVWDPALQAAAL